jgi:predicted O-linked N-acetylglucosamine transferase (SPINDLY family)
VGELPALKAGHVAFGSFNNFAKVTTPMLKLWGRIVAGVPGSRLVLKAMSLGSESARRRVLEVLAGEGIAAQRVEMMGHEPAHARHLEQYDRVDIALDTFPYCGTTTTCEALWMGVPVVTLAGPTHVSRVGASLLANVGMDRLVAASAEQYIAIATALAGDVPALARMRAEMRQRMIASGLCDVSRLARAVEDAYRSMWERYCARR